MKQVFEHYEKWEDYKSGMFCSKTDYEDKKIELAINLLSDQSDFYDSMKKMILDWKIAADVNLTNNQQNRRAWLGAAACMYSCNCPEYLTRIAWGLLDKKTQSEANFTAEKVISEYENERNNIKTLFG